MDAGKDGVYYFLPCQVLFDFFPSIWDRNSVCYVFVAMCFIFCVGNLVPHCQREKVCIVAMMHKLITSLSRLLTGRQNEFGW